MTNRQALTEAQARWGAKAACQHDPDAPRKPTRDRAHRRYKTLTQTLEALAAQCAAARANPTRLAMLQAKRETVSTARDRSLSERARAPYSVGESMGVFFMVLGKGDTWEAAFADADAKTKKRADVPLPTVKRATRTPQERRSRATSTSTIPPAKPVTPTRPAAVVGKKRCADCHVVIMSRTRCPACALKYWRAQHPDQRRAQDQRYRAKRPKQVRALVRARVAAWRKRNRITTHKKGGA